MDNTDVFKRLRERVERQIEQRHAELLPFHAYVCSLEKAGYDSAAARYVLECMKQELIKWQDIEDRINAFAPAVRNRLRA
ncbi:hypothetical protein AWB74_07590 [Caballeronia arvi]|uniref:Uncharacterized protein n=1 Tax=Caballeronia arvi TaxID=1777135 RepID=A0A158KYG6_9BURK|nr:hypothetical protein [Caballeronia arvi]SAL86164.1 hypothetical protein AWB74_07590 [Caballeronia arvi]